MGIELWQIFESRIEKEAPLFACTCWRIPSEKRIINKNGRQITVPIKSHPDFTAGILGLAAFFDAKSTKSESWSLQDYVFRKDSSADKLHQWQKLEEAASRGNIAGYLIWMSHHRMIVWASVETIRRLQKEGVKSIRPDTPGCVSIADDKPINLRSFMKHEIMQRVNAVRGIP